MLLPGCGPRIETRLDLWNNATGPHLRGACFSQRRVIPDLDGETFLGSGPVGAPISDDALASLARSGANLALLSHPGIYTERPPYRFDEPVAEHLIDLVDRCARAGLYVVVAFRSGPGRTEFSLHRDSAGDWFPADLVDERVWQSSEARNAWSAMWGHAAVLLRNRANVAGYLLMVEPNANQAALGPNGEAIDIWDADRLRDTLSGTQGDWPAMASAMARSIRSFDTETPILVSPDGYANARFAPLLDLEAVPGMVLAIHDYEPRAYTHGDAGSGEFYDPADAPVMPPEAARWMLGEFGVRRWMPGSGGFIAARMDALERAGAASAYFRWDSGWQPYESQENAWNPLYGSDPAADSPSDLSPVRGALENAWRANRMRP
ncbi:glycoside hydrolase family 5 protein [Hyphobacterium marinum]|uniref:Cellulase family glycosylhydrolase n=1 Tax=Hyphobacterium marinum TaxID=3116574 RepID=A0ABU7LZ00_9PROT|nr:cellulase family glycosylhydrolase [Hyphobacterium sp. Y6023]MEE2566782.1 cellulase family glycosylhydrolase [Hyphobacterium sp. Y6023]